MMNYIWAAMICLGIGFACFNGTLGSFTDGLMESCTQAVELERSYEHSGKIRIN